jgi:16S rRNA (adenine1518-N6/adenine1519-N6)-dimethyltransferase
VIPALPPLRDVIARHGLQASKALGQNFLLDGKLLDKIATVAGDLAGQFVYEIGPGPGGLTRALLKAGAHVTAVERDHRCVPALTELKTFFPDQLVIVEGDALTVRLDDILPSGGHIVANLPYNIGSALLVKWLTAPLWPPRWISLTLMFQREVADRIIAVPDTSAYGRLSVLAQWRSVPRIAMPVHRSAFTPPPSIMSAVIHMLPLESPAGVKIEEIETLTAAAFGQRRKMLRQSLKGISNALAALEMLGIDSTRRAETLKPEDFVDIARAITALKA